MSVSTATADRRSQNIFRARSPQRLSTPAGVRARSATSGSASDDFTLSRNLKKDVRGNDVRQLQDILNANGIPVDIDGVFGDQTKGAVRQLQQRLGVKVDGIFGPKTLAALRDQGGDLFTGNAGRHQTALPAREGEARAGTRVNTGAMGADGIRRTLEANLPARRGNGPAEGRAQFTSTVASGTTGEGKLGKITVNGNTYDFVSGRGRDGGGGGYGHLPPGEYTVTRHRDSRLDKSTMRVGNTGYSFALNNKYDERVGRTRSLLRIHPDGGREGTIGCIGIKGDEATQKRFRADMLAAIRANGGSYKLVVG